MGTSDTLRSVIDAGQSSKRLDELSSARVVGKVARQIHAAQQRAGAGKAVGPVTPAHIKLLPSGDATLELGGGSALGYSSPEQIDGGAGDRRSDVFSLGAVLWEALTHARLFDAMNDAAVKAAVKEREITAPAEINANVPAELSAICMRALSRNPTDRYQSLKAMAVEIEEFLEEAGYADSDAKIASYLKTLHASPQATKAAPLPAETHAKGTKPPPNVLVAPAAPSMLGEPPAQTRPKTPTGADIAAALANAAAAAGSSAPGTRASDSPSASSAAPAPSAPSAPASTASASASGETALPRAQAAVTAAGVPKLAEWQDASTPAHAPPPAAAPVVSVENAEPASAASSPSVPLPPVLPSGSASLPPDRSTIAASVPPQVKVETVDTKAQAQSASKPATAGAATPIETPENAKATLVDTKPPEIEVPKLVDGKLPDAANAGAASPSDKATGRAPSRSDAAGARASSQSDATRGRASSKSDATGRRASSHSDAVPRGAAGSKSSPHPAAAVSLGPIPGSRDSKDVLAGWGWGTDKHDAITDGYADDDYDSDTQRSKKMLTYLIGGGLGLAALVTIVALAFGGSSNNKDTKAVAKQTEPARPAIDQPSATAPGALDPAAQPAAAATAEGSAAAELAAASADGSAAAANADGSAVTADGSAASAGSAAAVEGSAAQAEADRLAAENAEADRLAAENAEADRLAAEKAEADRVAAEKHAEAERIAADKQAKKEEAARLAAEKAAARKAEAARVAAEKKAKKEEAARLAAEKAAARKAESARVAAERKAKREAAAQRAGTKSTTHTKTARKTVASAESKGDAQAAYRTGIQQYARGDTSGALASLRKALAANPSYAPTWRGLGLVYEKTGEKAQARAAYKRYLQLAPSAGDAAQIRGRLERLGS